ncbi:MAG: SsrA-binding protein SmpB [Spirochaetales bacterium]|nr:SsrA-binding protein SmpB [Spirochaetales bacterium]
MAVKSKKKEGLLAENRKARFNYIIEETLECGIVLQGTEVKAVKAGHISFQDSFVEITRGELYIKNLHITPWEYGNIFNHRPDRYRKLLAHKKEIEKLDRKVNERGYTIVPLKFYLVKGRVKVEIGLGKGKKAYDKRSTIRDRDVKRDMDREVKKKYL